ncbi:MAG TPA: JAB domain-containing protein [Terriglobia bacterium]|nr:JAB domain-containing protein [Terriglobia bacterium]
MIAVGAVGFIISHNHPSGDTVPSRADEELTKRLYKAGQLVGIALQDHILTEPGGTWRALRATNPELWERIL